MNCTTTSTSFLYKGGTSSAVPSNTTHLWVDASVEKIKESAFRHCRELMEVHLSEGLKCIGGEAFKGCAFLERMNLPSTLASVGYGAFAECDILEFTSSQVVYDGESTKIPRYATTLLVISPNIPPLPMYLVEIKIYEGVQVIGNEFQYHRTLKRITLPSTVKALPCGAFKGCAVLEEINLPECLETTGQSTFRSCKSLQTLRVPPSVTKLERNSFDGCTSLLSIELPEGLRSIEKFTINNFSQNFRNVAFPKGCECNTGSLGNSIRGGDLGKIFSGKDSVAVFDALKGRFA